MTDDEWPSTATDDPSRSSHHLGRRSFLAVSAAVAGAAATAPWAEAAPRQQKATSESVSQVAEPSATQETVDYTGFDGFSSITYNSRFFGADNAMNRDFTYYGSSFEQVVTTTVNLPIGSSLFAHGARMLAGPVYGSQASNGHPYDDVVFHDPAAGSVWLLGGNGDGTFESDPTQVALGRKGGVLLVGDVRASGFADLGIYDAPTGLVHWLLGDGSGQFRPGPTSQVARGADQILALDVTGDGRADIVTFHASNLITTWSGDGRGGFRQLRQDRWPEATSGGTLIGADFGEHHWGDLAFCWSAAFPDGLSFRMGNGDGTFGPLRDQVSPLLDSHGACQYALTETTSVIAAGQINSDGAADLVLYDPTTGELTSRLVFDDKPTYGVATQPAYDYSVDIIQDKGVYKMWSGGRWQTCELDPFKPDAVPTSLGDGDHILYSWSYDGQRWFRQRGPILFNGSEEGQSGWWTNNALEPEVVIVDGRYYMYWQVEIDPGNTVDTGETATFQADRIGLSTSRDGVHWTRKTDRSVVVGIDNPEETQLHHEECMYVAGDPEPFWMYVFHIVAGQEQGAVRMKTADPTTYNWADRESVSGIAQLGNQVGYVDDPTAGRVFVRITFSTDPSTGRGVPTIQLSQDGLTWVLPGGRPLLAGSTDDANPNCFFLGMSTLEHGLMEQVGPRTYRTVYGASTGQSPAGVPIFYSEIGTGELTFTLIS